MSLPLIEQFGIYRGRALFNNSRRLYILSHRLTSPNGRDNS